MKTTYSGFPIRVFKLIHHLETGGAERMFSSLALLIHETPGFEVHVGVLSGGGVFEKELSTAGIRVYVFNKRPFLNFDISISIRRLLKELRIDILHMHEFSAALWGRLAAYGNCRTARIVTDHSVAGWKNPIKHMLVNRILLSQTDKIVALTEAAKSSLVVRENVPSALVSVIPNGIDVETVSETPAGGLENRIPEFDWSIPILGTIGRYSYEKGNDVFIRACDVLNKKNIAFRAILVGDGPFRPRLQEMISGYGLEEKVHLTGVLPHSCIVGIIKQLTVAVVPSRQENCSIALLELMAAKACIVATNTGGNPEIIEDNVHGLIVPPEDPHRMAGAIELLVNDSCMRNRFSEKCHDRVLSRFSHSSMLNSYIELYRTTTEGKGRNSLN